MANTKLDKGQKAYLKGMKMHNPEVTFGYADRFTVARMEEFPGARMAQFSVSYAALDEQKVRRKVGEYHALDCMSCMEIVKLPAKFTAQDVAEWFMYGDQEIDE